MLPIGFGALAAFLGIYPYIGVVFVVVSLAVGSEALYARASLACILAANGLTLGAATSCAYTGLRGAEGRPIVHLAWLSLVLVIATFTIVPVLVPGFFSMYFVP
jgi:hypothetical protein